jgi:hypothetical protein
MGGGSRRAIIRLDIHSRVGFAVNVLLKLLAVDLLQYVFEQLQHVGSLYNSSTVSLPVQRDRCRFPKRASECCTYIVELNSNGQT